MLQAGLIGYVLFFVNIIMQKTEKILQSIGTLGYRMRISLEYANMTSNNLADLWKITTGKVSRWLNNHSRPKPEQIKDFAELTKVSHAWVATGEGKAPNVHPTPSNPDIDTRKESEYSSDTPINLEEEKMFRDILVDELLADKKRLLARVDQLEEDLREANLPRKTKKNKRG